MPEIAQVSFAGEAENRTISIVNVNDEVVTCPIDEDTYNDIQATLQDLSDKVNAEVEPSADDLAQSEDGEDGEEAAE